MTWSSWIRSVFKSSVKKKSIKKKIGARLAFENLEERVMPYSVTGNAWPDPKLVSISFMPDGTPMSSAVGSTITSNLFSTMNAKFGSPAVWEAQILRAAQVWAQQTNINFSVVADNGAPSGSGTNEQGDPGFGDIRIGGYSFGNSTLASAFQPPPVNNYSVAGDIAFNTGQTWNVGTTYDLFTVAAHEIGHTLGMDHSSAATTAIMYPSYTGIKSALSTDDVAGIRNIYSSNAARTADAYDAGYGNNTLATATNIGSLINTSSLTALVNNLDLTTTSDLDYYTFTAPTGTTGTMQVQIQSQGLSLLTPKVTVYAANGITVLGTASGLNQYGTTLDVNITGVTAGTRYYVKVQGADTTAFSTGAYALGLKFGANATPVAATPSVVVAAGTVHSAGGGIADGSANADTLLSSIPKITRITPDNGLSANDLVTNAQNIRLVGSAPTGNLINVYSLNNGTLTLLGTTTVAGGNNWTFNDTGITLAPGMYTFTATATDANGNVSALANAVTVTIDTSIPSAPAITGITPDTGFSPSDGITNVNNPTLQGTAPANTLVTIYQNKPDGAHPFGSVMSSSMGDWSFQGSTLDNGTYCFTASATSLAGNVSPISSALSVTIDTQAPSAPAITGITPDTGVAGDGATSSSQITLLGTASPNTLIQVFNGGALAGNTMTDSNGSWQFNNTGTSLPQGIYQFTVQATDIGGNVSTLSQPYKVVIETSLPATPVVTTISNDTGVSASDFITSGQSQIFNGTCGTPNGSVQLFLDGNAIGTTTASNNGTWSFDYRATLIPVGTHTIQAQVTDYIGNVSALSAPITLTIDQTAPIMPVITGWGSYTGTLGTSSTVNVNTPYFVGTAEAYSTVTLLKNGQPLGTTTADANGNWRFIAPQLGANTYSISATATDLAGNLGTACAPISLTVTSNYRAPAVPNSIGLASETDSGTLGDNATNDQNIKLTGTAPSNLNVLIFSNGNVIGTTNADASGNWKFDYSHTTLAPGSYNFTAAAMDSLGNISQQSSVCTVLIQTTPPPTPVVTGISANSGLSSTDLITNVKSQIFSGACATPNGTVQVFIDGHAIGTTAAGPNGSWTFDNRSSNISEGTHLITAQVTDYLGNVSALSAPLTVVIDTTAPNSPKILSWSPDSGRSTTDGITDVNTPTFYGTAEANSIITVRNGNQALGTTSADMSGNWQFTTPALPDGGEAITVTATDIAGNTGSASNLLTFTVDTQAPQAPAISGLASQTDSGTLGDGVTNNPNIMLHGTAVANTSVMLSNNGNSIGTAPVNSNGAWQFDYSHTTLASGTYLFTAMTIDVAGNVSATSKPYLLTIALQADSAPKAPAVPSISADSGVSNTDNLTNISYQDFSGNCNTGNGNVQVFIDGSAIGSTTANGQGAWAFNYSQTAIQGGTHLITAQVTDSVGNVSAMSAPLTLVIDQTAPIKPSITSWGPDTGSNSQDGITNCNTPTIYGTAEAGSTVTVLDNGHALGTVIATAAGAWQFTSAPLSDGIHSLTATATDLAGNLSQASTGRTITILTRIGGVQVLGITPDTGLNHNDGITNVRNISIQGKSDPNDTIQVFQGGVSIGTTKANSSGAWTFDDTGTSLADGTYPFTASASDAAGNVSTLAKTYAVTIDTSVPAPPVIAGITRNNGLSTQTLTLGGTALAQSQVSVYLAGSLLGTANTNNQGQWSYNYTSTSFANRTYLFTARATSLAGNVSTVSNPGFKLLLGNGMQNLAAPQLTAASVLSVDNSGKQTSLATPTLTGNAKAGTLVTIVDGNIVLGTAVANSTGHWTFTSPTLAKGNHMVSVFATDFLGDEGLLSAALAFQV